MRRLRIDKRPQMQLRAFFRRHSKKATPIAVHIFMLLGVALYTIFGAMIMQRIESETIQGPRLYQQQQPAGDGVVTKRMGKRAIAAIIEESHEHQHQIRHRTKLMQKGGGGGGDQQMGECISNILKDFNEARCNISKLKYDLEQCHNEISFLRKSGSSEEIIKGDVKKSAPRFGWSFTDSVLFCFTVITTIGYGNVAPKTFSGQLFCILYALVGIPFTLLAIADLGKFLSEVLESWENVYLRMRKRIIRYWRLMRGRPKFSFVSLANNLDANNNNNNNNMVMDQIEDGPKLSSSTFPAPMKKITPTIIVGVPEEEERMAMLDKAEKGEWGGGNMMGDGGGGRGMEQQQPNGNIKENGDGTPPPPPPPPGVKKEEDDDAKSEQSDHFEHTQAIPLLIFFLIYVFSGACLLTIYEPDMNFFKAIYFNFVSLTSIGLGDVVPQSETYMALTLLYIAVGLALTTIAIEIAADYLKKLHYFGRKIENVGNVVIWFGGKRLTMKQLVKNLGDQFNLPVHQVKTLDLDKFVDDAIKVEEGELDTLRPTPIEPKDLLEEGTLNFADDDTEIEEWVRQKTPSTSPEPEYRAKPENESEEEEEEGPLPELEFESQQTPSPEPEAQFERTEAEEESESQATILLNSPEPEGEQKEKEEEPATETEPEMEKPAESDAEESVKEEKSLGTMTPPDMERRKSNYSDEAWRRYLEYQKQWRKFRHTQSTTQPPLGVHLMEGGTSSSSRRPSSSMSARGSFASTAGGKQQIGTPQRKQQLPPKPPKEPIAHSSVSTSPAKRGQTPTAGASPNRLTATNSAAAQQPKRSTASSRSGGSSSNDDGHHRRGASRSPRKGRRKGGEQEEWK